MLKKISFVLLLSAALVAFFACGNSSKTAPQESFAKERINFKTKLTQQKTYDTEVETPPANRYKIVKYPASLGDFPAYLSVVPNDGKLRPAMIWITGGWGNDIGDVWSKQDVENDQSAAGIAQAGVIMMYPSLRAGNGNPGYDESAYGEIDDIIAAAKFLAKQPGVDPKRIYLGGHSTGGTKVLLTAEASDMFRAVFSFGPVDAYESYGEEYATFDIKNEKEFAMRAPVLWLSSIKSPTIVIEGKEEGNYDALKVMENEAKDQNLSGIQFFGVENKDHFSVLGAAYPVIGAKIMADTNEKCNISFSAAEIEAIGKTQ